MNEIPACSWTARCPSSGYYGDELDGANQPKLQGKKKAEGEEETELIRDSSEDEMDDDGDLASVATTPPMKPVVTDRSAAICLSTTLALKTLIFAWVLNLVLKP